MTTRMDSLVRSETTATEVQEHHISGHKNLEPWMGVSVRWLMGMYSFCLHDGFGLVSGYKEDGQKSTR